uniref:Uncharacterized protein n=1 Tax=Arundo donax TaxID=35708 RepID=A0A0A9FN44_ARUDO
MCKCRFCLINIELLCSIIMTFTKVLITI